MKIDSVASGKIAISGTLVCRNAAGEIVKEIAMRSAVPLDDISIEQREALAAALADGDLTVSVDPVALSRISKE
jgi:hypothetical protein